MDAVYLVYGFVGLIRLGFAIHSWIQKVRGRLWRTPQAQVTCIALDVVLVLLTLSAFVFDSNGTFFVLALTFGFLTYLDFNNYRNTGRKVESSQT